MTDRIEKPIVSPDPDVSVVIPTIPENDHDQVVSHLRDQTHDDYEVIVVNDGDIGVCEARNEGIKASSSPLVAFTDDDTHPPDDWIEVIHQSFSETSAGIIEGPVSGGFEHTTPGMYVTCNMAVHRECFEEIGMFDSLLDGWREDTDLGWRVEKAFGSKWIEEMEMVHEGPPNSSYDPDLEAVFREKHPEMYQERVVPDSILGKVNHQLWKLGFWDVVDKVRS
ncbi:Glycosyl transferase family 2 [Halorientalis persicus]|uniref:Glycosyl transferase family 2 n=1 Tax=Halorientalis persicus TaxID=1367881 RepID=A0A1H8W6I2_9EURY|nr:glycosyltransferase [Halorientalis persicus]SEP23264.1 Glycosyl transferase family 2 [Halorientalis persicus]